MTNREEHLLLLLAEECGEVAKECLKAVRFGLDDYDPREPEGPNNAQRLVNEIQDVYAVLDMLSASHVVPTVRDHAKVSRKKEKLVRYSAVSVEKGKLDNVL